MSGLIQTPFLNTAHDDTTTISLDPCMPTQLSTPFEHLARPVHGGNHSMYTPPDPHTFPHNGYSLPYDQPQYPNQPVAGPSFAPPPFHLQHDPSPIGDYQYGFPDNGDWQGNTDWDEDEYRDGDVIYGNLEVSDQNPNQNQNQNQNQNPGTAFQSPSSLPPPHVPDKSAPKQVKHRRRTTPEQLKVLEHWFDINSKPDNNLREWLASELGMTKRNIQVWFQNR